jgi:putative endonuclease
MYFVYILYSKTIDKFYVGETVDLAARLDLHNNGEFDLSYTKQARDWMLYFKLECPDRTVARRIELHIKKMKSRKYYENLLKYPEISKKLIKSYS